MSEESQEDFEYDPCSICAEGIDDSNAFTTPCNHSFHKECLETWFTTCRDGGREQSCPLCREVLNDVLNAMEDGDRETYLEYADTLGVRIAFERQKILLASNLIEALVQWPVQRYTGVDIRGSSQLIEQCIDSSLERGDDLFAMEEGGNRGKSILAILGIVAVSIFGAIFANRSAER